jgi:hypothetical protein
VVQLVGWGFNSWGRSLFSQLVNCHNGYEANNLEWCDDVPPQLSYASHNVIIGAENMGKTESQFQGAGLLSIGLQGAALGTWEMSTRHSWALPRYHDLPAAGGSNAPRSSPLFGQTDDFMPLRTGHDYLNPGTGFGCVLKGGHVIGSALDAARTQ